MTELHDAVESGDLVRVRRILLSDPSRVHDRDNEYATPLHYVYYGVNRNKQDNERLRILQILLESGSDPNVRAWGWDYIPLPLAIGVNQIEGVKLLLEYGANPNTRDSYSRTVLHLAMRQNKQIVELLLEHGADINAVTGEGETPLDFAIYCNDSEKARILMDAGGKSRQIFNNATDPEIRKQPREMLIFLIQHGTEIDLSRQFSIKALYFAWTKSHREEFVKNVMFEQGIDVDNFKREGAEMTELHVAVESMNKNRVRDLLEGGADVNAKNVLCQTPLHLLITEETNIDDEYTLYKIAKLLIKAGADLHARDCFGFTPFNLAVYWRYSEVVNLMLAKISGVKKNTLNNEVTDDLWESEERDFFRTLYPLAVAIALGYKKVVDRLIEMGHHIELTCITNRKLPLCHAIEHDYEIVKMLLEAGCRTNGPFPFSKPFLDIRHDEGHLEVVCLLWEYSSITTLITLMTMAIRSIIVSEVDLSDCDFLLVFFYKLGLHSNKLNKDVIVFKGLYYPNERLSSILTSYDNQINELKTDFVNGRTSKFDLLTMKLDLLVNFLNDANNLKAVVELRSSFDNNEEAFDSYKFAFKIRIDLAIKKRKLLDSAINCLTETLRDFTDFKNFKCIPHEIICYILSFLTIRELKKCQPKIKM